jgi:hypothetical protein
MLDERTRRASGGATFFSFCNILKELAPPKYCGDLMQVQAIVYYPNHVSGSHRWGDFLHVSPFPELTPLPWRASFCSLAIPSLTSCKGFACASNRKSGTLKIKNHTQSL